MVSSNVKAGIETERTVGSDDTEGRTFMAKWGLGGTRRQASRKDDSVELDKVSASDSMVVKPSRKCADLPTSETEEELSVVAFLDSAIPCYLLYNLLNVYDTKGKKGRKLEF